MKYYNGQIFGGGIQTLQMYGDFGRFHLIISGNMMSSDQNSLLVRLYRVLGTCPKAYRLLKGVSIERAPCSLAYF